MSEEQRSLVVQNKPDASTHVSSRVGPTKPSPLGDNTGLGPARAPVFRARPWALSLHFCAPVSESFSSRPDAALLPEVTASGLVLWRLRISDHQLWCTVEDFAGELVLRVQDHATGHTVISETHITAASVVESADELRDQFIAGGWDMVDGEVDDSD